VVGDATEEEAERLLLKALPIEWRKKVEMEVDKRNRDGVLVIEGLPSSLDAAKVNAFVMVETGRQPKTVEPQPGGKWKVRGLDESHRTALMQLNRLRLDSGARLTVRQVEERLKVHDLDALMRRWLKVDERVSAGSRSDRSEGFKRDEDRRQRFTREVSADPKSDEQGDDEQVIARVDASKAPARSTEVHPNKGKGNHNTSDPPKEPPKDTVAASEASPPPSPGTPGMASPIGVSGAAGSLPQQHHVSPHMPGHIQHWDNANWGWYPPHPMCWDPSWGAGWYQGQYGKGSGKGSDGKGGKGNEHQAAGKGSGGKGKGKGSEGKGKGGRGHP
jgi:hypothetical protein